MDKIILAFYINGSVISDFMENEDKIKERFDPEKYMIAYFSTEGESHIECVYPKFIASSEFIEENKNLLNELTKDLKKTIKQPKNGVYILFNEELFTIEDWKKQSDLTIATHVVLITEYCRLKIDKNIIGYMPYNKAIKYNLPDTTQAHLIALNRKKLKEAIGLIGGEWGDGWIWTRAEYSKNDAWIYYGYNGGLFSHRKDNTGGVRPVTTFQN